MYLSYQSREAKALGSLYPWNGKAGNGNAIDNIIFEETKRTCGQPFEDGECILKTTNIFMHP